MLPIRPGDIPSPKLKSTLVLYDPQGETAGIMKKSKVGFKEIKELKEQIDFATLIIGRNAFVNKTVSEEGIKQLKGFVKKGGTLLIFAHKVYPRFLKDWLKMPDAYYKGKATMSFPRAIGHPILKGIEGSDLRFWRDNYLVAKDTFIKPAGKPFRTIVDHSSYGFGDYDISGVIYAGLGEYFVERGRIILNQLLVTDKFDKEPVARVIFKNLLEYASSSFPRRLPVAAVSLGKEAKDILDSIGLVYEDITDKIRETDLKKYSLILAGEGKEAEEDLEKLFSFAKEGGKVLFHKFAQERLKNLKPVSSFIPPMMKGNRYQLIIEEKDPVTWGLSNQELYWLEEILDEEGKVIVPKVVPGQISNLFAPVAAFKGKPKKIEPKDILFDPTCRRDGEGMLLRSDNWARFPAKFDKSGTYLFQVKAKVGQAPPQLEWEKEKVASGFWQVYRGYPVQLNIDNKKTLGWFFLTGQEPQEYQFVAEVKAGLHEIGISAGSLWVLFELVHTRIVNKPFGDLQEVKWSGAVGQPPWIKEIKYGLCEPLSNRKCIYLTQPGALLKVPYGKGFIIIDEINWDTEKSYAIRAKRFITTLLVNLGARFDLYAGK